MFNGNVLDLANIRWWLYEQSTGLEEHWCWRWRDISFRVWIILWRWRDSGIGGVSSSCPLDIHGTSCKWLIVLYAVFYTPPFPHDARFWPCTWRRLLPWQRWAPPPRKRFCGFHWPRSEWDARASPYFYEQRQFPKQNTKFELIDKARLNEGQRT